MTVANRQNSQTHLKYFSPLSRYEQQLHISQTHLKYFPPLSRYEQQLHIICEISYVQEFWRYWNNIERENLRVRGMI
jgi:hypothetical protein